MFKLVQDVEDLKLRRIYSLALVEDVLSKRPFSKVLALTLLNINSDLRQGSWFDFAKLARECLKSLTGEDFRQLYIQHREVMQDFENYYVNINGSAVDNELAKIVMRYVKEGKPQNVFSAIPPAAVLEEVKVEEVKLEEQDLNKSHVSHHSHHQSQTLDKSGVAVLQDATNRSVN